MSGIAGIFYRNNKPVQLEQLQAMGAALQHRGPDGINYYCKDSVGFVHCMLHDTPESLFETLPNKTDDGNFVITFHGRIDNRQELYDKIGWIKPLSLVTDSDLVLAAYRKWRKECVDYLLGDFAFAIWDEVERKLFCARDHMGVKPFYYYCTERLFTFSSEIKGHLALPEIPRVLNEERVADFFTSIVLENSSTFFENINRLPPGHVLQISDKRKELYRYHTFTPAALSFETDTDYEEAFREIFVDAVRVRLRSTFQVGAYLSGGLDSGAIVSIAAGILDGTLPSKLQTFSGVFNKLEKCDERQFFNLIVNRFSLISHTLPVDSINPSIAYEKLINDEDEPFWAPHVFMSMGLLDLMKNGDIRVLLDGHDGDAAISYGYSRMAEFALSGNVCALFKSYKQGGTYKSKSIIKRIYMLYWSIFCNNLPVFLPGSSVRAEIKRSLQTLNPDFLRRIGIKERLRVRSNDSPKFGMKEKEYHFKNITQPIHPYALEFLERVAVKCGIVARYPFFDKRVIEFCMALPAAQKFQCGFNRVIVRKALANSLPEGVSERKGKTDFAPSLLHAFSAHDGGWLLGNVDAVTESDYTYARKGYFLMNKKNLCDTTRIDRIRILIDFLCLVSFSRWKRKHFY